MSENKNLKRRQFIKASAIAGTALATSAGLGRTAMAAKRYNWKLTTTWPPNFPIFQDGVKRFANDVKKMTGGALNIHTFAAGELIPAMQTFDAVSQGTVQMGHGAAYYWIGKIPSAAFFTSVPFGMNAQGMNAWLYSGGGLDLWREIYAEHNLIPFPMGNTGVQMGGWFRKEIARVEDLKGLKMRIPGFGGKVMAKAGVNPVLLAGGEIYTALERGTIDATEWVGPYHDERLGLYRAAKHYYYPGWHEPGPTLELTVNRKAWEELPAEIQLIVETAAMASNLWMLSEFEAKNLDALHTLLNKYKVQISQFPEDVIKQLKLYTADVLAEEAEKDKLFRKVLDAYSAFHKNNDAWNLISEAAYAKAQAL